MDPLQAVPMPTHGVLLKLTTTNSWLSGSVAEPLRLTYIASNSTESVSYVSLAAHPGNVLRLASRKSYFDDMSYGVVIEVYLSRELAEGETVELSLAQAGATTYFPPQQIDDRA